MTPRPDQSPETVSCQFKRHIECRLPVASSATAAYGCVVADGGCAPELAQTSKCIVTLCQLNFVQAHLHRELGTQEVLPLRKKLRRQT